MRTLPRLLLPLLFALTAAAADVPIAQRITALAGAGAKNCEMGGTNEASPGSMSEPCLINSFQAHVAAYWTPGSPTGGIRGIAVVADGTVFIADTTSADVHRCTQPRVIQQFGRRRLRCGERYIAPYKAEIIPMRTGNGVQPPRPKTAIHVPAAACDPAGPGRKIDAEFIVDADGKLLFVDILGAPRQCDMPALEAYLNSVTFDPATLDGAPVAASWFTILFLR